MNNTNLKVGMVIRFGVYDGPMQWRVYEVNGQKALLICENVIEDREFSASYNNYEGSSIRSWLNDDFLDWFTEEEKSRMVKTLVDNSIYSTVDDENEYVCENTKDFVFLLSIKEAKSYFPTASSRRVHRIGSNEYAAWWLRSPYCDADDMTDVVLEDGSIDDENVSEEYGIRPACWIRM